MIAFNGFTSIFSPYIFGIMFLIMTRSHEADDEFAVSKKTNDAEQVEGFVVKSFLEGFEPFVLTQFFQEHELGYFLRCFGNSGRPSLSLTYHDSMFSFFSRR